MSDRSRRIYLRGLRIDITVRDGVPTLVPLRRLGRAIAAAAGSAGAPGTASVGLLLTDDAELADLNREHMGHHGPTDVLSFPLLPPAVFDRPGSPPSPREARSFALPPGVRTSLGDIAVSVERAVAQAREGRGGHDARTAWDTAQELLLLVTHGTLHLCGWDHADPAERDAMQALERHLLEGRR